MGKVLVLFEKYGDGARVVDISTDEKRDRAYLAIFKERDADHYSDLREVQSLLYQKAKQGDAVAARRLLRWRSSNGYEYERILETELEEF